MDANRDLLSRAAAIAPALRTLLSEQESVILRYTDAETLPAPTLTIGAGLSDEVLTETVTNFLKEKGLPASVLVEGIGAFLCTPSRRSGRLAGRVAVVTGGAQGFGKGTAVDTQNVRTGQRSAECSLQHKT